MRGRLVFKFLAEIHRLDTTATADVATAGYDDDFKEPLRIDENADGLGESVRTEHSPVRVPCQVEPDSFEQLGMAASGNAPRSKIELLFHFKDLERMGLVDTASGDALIRPGDRLGAIYDKCNTLIQAIKNPPGLSVTEAKSIGFGLNMARPRRNLLLVSFDQREQGTRRR